MLLPVLAFMISVSSLLILARFFLPFMQKLKFGQPIHELALESHQAKQGTLTMGGLMFASVTSILSLIFSIFTGFSVATLLLVLFALVAMMIGFTDDYVKIKHNNNKGIKWWQKVLPQILIGFLFSLYCYNSPSVGSSIIIPFTDLEWNLGILYIPLMTLVIMFIINSANLLDGMDGLLTSTSSIASIAWAAIAMFFMVTSSVIPKNDLYGILFFTLTLAGSLFAFLRYNYHPAKTFMGDTGSMFIGAAMAGVALLLRQPLLLVLITFTMIMSSVSVIMQRTYYKLTHGKRIFKVSPIHYHFEKNGMNEPQIVAMYSAVESILAVIAVLSASLDVIGGSIVIKANERVLVVGMARSGIAAAKLLLAHGAIPVLSDSRSMDAFADQLDELKSTDCIFRLGVDALSLLDTCDRVVISPGVPIDSPIVQQAKSKGIPLIGEMELAFSLLQGHVIAVTGTNGKTTTVSLLGELFSNAGYTVHVGGNIGYPLSAIAGYSKPNDIIIAEVSSFQLESINTFHPETAALLNITEDHLNRHYSMESYIALKQRIFENQTNNNLAVINRDDTTVMQMANAITPKICYFSRIQSVDNGVCLQGDTVVSVTCGVQTPICKQDDILIPGPHNLENAMAAIAIGIAYGITPAVIKHTLQTFTGVEHRIETVRTVNHITYINDSKGTNVASTIKAVQSMKVPTVIILGGYDKHTSFSELSALIAKESHIMHAVLLGQTADQIAKSLSANGFHSYTHACSLEDSIFKASDHALAGGNVLFSPACASFDMFSDYEQRGTAYKQIVNSLQNKA